MIISAQSNQLNVSEISFTQKDSITNLEQYRKGLKENLNSLMHSFGETKESPPYKKMRMLNDSILNNIPNDNFEKEIKTFSYKKINDSIISRIEGVGQLNDKNTIIKKSKKRINGYDCYKVTYEYKNNDKTGDEDFMEYAGNMIYTREMWVTDKIKSPYHPVIYDKSILERYYPLDILETQNDVKGFERRFVLQKITLQ